MTTALIPAPERTDLASLSLTDCPDLPTAIAAGIAHGLPEREALKSAFMKYMREHEPDFQRFKLANFYDENDKGRAFVDWTGMIQFLLVRVVTQQQQIDALQAAQDQRIPPTPP